MLRRVLLKFRNIEATFAITLYAVLCILYTKKLIQLNQLNPCLESWLRYVILFTNYPNDRAAYFTQSTQRKMHIFCWEKRLLSLLFSFHVMLIFNKEYFLRQYFIYIDKYIEREVHFCVLERRNYPFHKNIIKFYREK